MKLDRNEFEARWAGGELAVSLVGMSNIGKSWLAGRLSEGLGTPALEVDTFIREELGQTSMADFAHWLGHPDTSGYAEREARSLAIEERATLAALGAMPRPGVLDTTGSVIYCERSCERLRVETYVVYLSAGVDIRLRLQELYFSHPKPLNWNGHFQPEPGESFGDTVARCYPELLDARDTAYAALADHTVPASAIFAPGLGADDLWSLLKPAA